MPNKNNKTVPMPLFNEVENETLRTWNRCITFANLKSNFGDDKATEYASKFPSDVTKQMLIMFTYVADKGYDEVRPEINRIAVVGDAQ